MLNRLNEIKDAEITTWSKKKTDSQERKPSDISIDSLENLTETEKLVFNTINSFTSYMRVVIEQIEKLAESMSYIYKRAIKETSNKAYEEITNTLDSMTAQVSEITADGREKIQQFKESFEAEEFKKNVGKKQKLGNELRLVIGNLTATYSSKLNEVVGEYTTTCQNTKKEIQKKIVNQAKIIDKGFSDQQIKDLIGTNDPAKYMRQSVLITEEVAGRIDEIDKKHQDILKIEKGIDKIKELFDNLKFLVDQQQGLIDNIQENIIKTKVDVTAGEENLRAGKKNLSDANRRIIIISIVAVIIIVIIILFATDKL